MEYQRRRIAYRLGPVVIDVCTNDSEALAWLSGVLLPWFEVCPSCDSNLHVALTSSQSVYEALERHQATTSSRTMPCFRLETRVIELPGWNDGDDSVLADAGNECFYRVRPGHVEIVARPG